MGGFGRDVAQLVRNVRDVSGRNLSKLRFREGVEVLEEEPLIISRSPGLVTLFGVGKKNGEDVGNRDRRQGLFPERLRSKDALCLKARLGERDDGVAADRSPSAARD